MSDGTGGCSRFDCAQGGLEAQPGRADDAWRIRTLACASQVPTSGEAQDALLLVATERVRYPKPL